MAITTKARRNPLAVRDGEPVALASEGRSSTKLRYMQIRADGGTQMRALIDETTVGEYADELRRGAVFPPVVVFYDGEHYWLGDGFHRVRAYFLAFGQETEISAEVRPGTRREAVLCAAGANAVHGLRRTNADKRRAVETLLRDEEWGRWSDREIARRCHVHHDMVAAARKTILAESASMNGERILAESASMNGEKILADSASMNQPTPTTANRSQDERIFVHPKTGEPTTMNISGQRRMRIPKGYTPPAAQPPSPKPALSLDEAIALVWQAIKDFVRGNDAAARLEWLNSLPGDDGFYRDTPADRSLPAETLQAAQERVISELRSQLAHAAGKAQRQLRTVETAQPAFASASEAEEMPARQRGVAGLLALYREVEDSLIEYSQVTGQQAQAQALKQALAPMIHELESGQL